MPDVYRVRITPEALANLEAIFEVIQKDSPQNARGMIRRLPDAIDSLRTFPHRYNTPRTGPPPPQHAAIRSMPVRPYLVRYRIDEQHKAVFILRVRHGARREP